MRISIRKLDKSEITRIMGGNFTATIFNMSNSCWNEIKTLGIEISQSIAESGKFIDEKLPEITSDTLKFVGAITIPVATLIFAFGIVKCCKIIPPPAKSKFIQHYL